MNPEQLRIRTKLFAVQVIIFCRTIPNNLENSLIKRQLIRSATSVGANYRAVCRARSKAEFYSKLCIVVEEIDESLFWFEIMEESEIGKNNQFLTLKSEALELLKIFSVSRKTAKIN